MLSDALLLEGVRRGDELAFESLFHRYYPRVYRLLYFLVGSRAQAEELTQEVFIQLFRRPLRSGDNVGAWLRRVATNLGYNAMRAEKRRTGREEAVTAETPSTAPSAAAEAERRIVAAEVSRTLNSLNPRQAQLLLLRQLGLPYQELAEVFNVSRGSVGTLLARAERAFRREYKGER
jgi:RNA polymerase sigma-70 factor (ECF subfamily)